MLLSLGKCTIAHSPSENGAPTAANNSWKALDTPKDTTTKLTSTAGAEQEALEEGGGLVDCRTGKNKYTFEFDHFVKKGQIDAFDDEDGIISGEHAFRVTPEDPTCKGFQIDRCTIRVEESYTTTDGIVRHYVCKVLQPKTGKMVKPFIKGAPVPPLQTGKLNPIT